MGSCASAPTDNNYSKAKPARYDSHQTISLKSTSSQPVNNTTYTNYGSRANSNTSKYNKVHAKYSRYDLSTIPLIISFWNHIHNSTPNHLCEDIRSLIQMFAKTEDKFDPTVTTQNMNISNNGLVVSKTTPYSASDWKAGCGFAFGSCLVDKHRCIIRKWKLQITKQENSGNLFPGIGICEDKEKYKFMRNMAVNDRSNSYSLAWDGKTYSRYTKNLHGMVYTYFKGKPYCEQLKLGDIIEMTLDMRQSTLSFVINDKDFGVMCKIDNSAKYRMYISMYCRTEITILDTCS